MSAIVDAAFSRVKQLGAPVVTTGGAPVAFATGTTKFRAVIVKDPDGHFVELAQPDPLPPTAAPDSANVIGVRVRLTVEDGEQAMRLYWDALGIRGVTPGLFSSDKAVLDMLGVKGGQYRLSTAQVPTSGLRMEFLEVKGVDRRVVRASIQDPGSTRMQLQVRDVDEAIGDVQEGRRHGGVDRRRNRGSARPRRCDHKGGDRPRSEQSLRGAAAGRAAAVAAVRSAGRLAAGKAYLACAVRLQAPPTICAHEWFTSARFSRP